MTASRPIAMSVVKTLSNSWATSMRYHEDVKKWCLVGCHCYLGSGEPDQGLRRHGLIRDAEGPPTDSLEHYLACPLLWSLIDSACRSPCTDWVLPVPERLCLVNPSIRRVKLLAIGYRVYHCIKMGHSETWDTAVQSNSYTLMHDLVLPLTRHFADEFLLHHG